MSYRAVKQAIDQYSDVLNTSDWANKGNRLQETYKGGSAGVNPYSSAAYGSSSDSIYGDIKPVVDPRSMFSDYKPNFLTQGTQGLKGYQMGAGLDPFAKSMAGTLGGTVPGAGWSGFGPAAALYGMTRNQNPYDWTSTEKWGTIGSTALAARSLAPMLGLTAAAPVATAATAPLLTPLASSIGAGAGASIAGMHPALLIGSLLLGGFFSKKGKRRAAAANRKVEEDITKQQTEGYEARSEKLLEQRSDYLSDLTSQAWEREQSRYDNQYGGNYNPYMGDEGMKFSPKELNKIAKAGRHGDTMLAHITPEESDLLQALGGSGTINPYTGLPEHFRWLKRIFKPVSKAVKKFHKATKPIVRTLARPTLGLGHKVLKKAHKPIHRTVRAAGDVTGKVIKTGIKTGRSALEGVADISSDAMKAANKVIEPVLQPVMSGLMDVADPIMDIIEDVSTPIMGGLHDLFKGGIEGGFDLIRDVSGWATDLLGSIFHGDDPPVNPYQVPQKFETKRQVQERKNIKPTSQKELKEEKIFPNITKAPEPVQLATGDWVSDKDNPFIRENVEMYDKGGKANIIAEFTGNELIVNNQDAVEKGLASGNYTMAAAPIRNAMKGGYITPGIEAHQGNPMPVDEGGSIYTKGGKLKFKVKKGAGIYDHATDQFKSTMTDKEIAMVAQQNINKWESNGMA